MCDHVILVIVNSLIKPQYIGNAFILELLKLHLNEIGYKL